MAENCCKLVGNLTLTGLDGCITSISVNSKSEIIKECGGEILLGPTTGTVSITGYAVTPTGEDSGVHTGCPGRAGVSIPWVRRYDCDNDDLYLISAGQGSSYVAGDIEGLASLVVSTGRSFPSLNASSTSGPATIYMETEQEEGYGLDYNGGPISFDTREELVINNFGVGSGPLYLQSFSVEFNPGEIPTASYSFLFVIND
ncbi:MAG: hypothetical protein PVG39_10220 [Desulfobacteraceae bacterium]|jgi:hypothetical protein